MVWTKEEVRLIVEDYFDMLKSEIDGKKYNKTKHREALKLLLNDRDKAIEYKHRNITAALMNLGLPFIKGYKPLFNYQDMIEEEIAIYLENNKKILEKKFNEFSENADIEKLSLLTTNFEHIVSKPPEPSKYVEKEPLFRPIKRNFLKREQNNRKLGEEGELFILNYEKWRLAKEGRKNLIDEIKWVSKDFGDGMGYDILSKNANGSDRFIEVKTTKLSKETPIYFTRNEAKFALKQSENFYLYRVFNFSNAPNVFIKNGAYDSFCQPIPDTFKGYF